MSASSSSSIDVGREIKKLQDSIKADEATIDRLDGIDLNIRETYQLKVALERRDVSVAELDRLQKMLEPSKGVASTAMAAIASMMPFTSRGVSTSAPPPPPAKLAPEPEPKPVSAPKPVKSAKVERSSVDPIPPPVMPKGLTVFPGLKRPYYPKEELERMREIAKGITPSVASDDKKKKKSQPKSEGMKKDEPSMDEIIRDLKNSMEESRRRQALALAPVPRRQQPVAKAQKSEIEDLSEDLDRMSMVAVSKKSSLSGPVLIEPKKKKTATTTMITRSAAVTSAAVQAQMEKHIKILSRHITLCDCMIIISAAEFHRVSVMASMDAGVGSGFVVSAANCMKVVQEAWNKVVLDKDNRLRPVALLRLSDFAEFRISWAFMLNSLYSLYDLPLDMHSRNLFNILVGCISGYSRTVQLGEQFASDEEKQTQFINAKLCANQLGSVSPVSITARNGETSHITCTRSLMQLFACMESK